MGKKEPLYPHVPKGRTPPTPMVPLETEAIEIERHYGIIVGVGGIKTKTPNLPDWDISYVEYPPGQMKRYRDALMKARVSIVRVTDMRIYFEEK